MAETSWKWSGRRRGWSREVVLPLLGTWRNAWSLFFGSIEGPDDVEIDSERSLSVVAAAPEEGPRPASPSRAQKAALAKLSADEAALDEALAQYLFDAMRNGTLGQCVPQPGDAENADEFRIYDRLHRPEGMRELLQLVEIEILPDEEDGLAHVVFNFDSAFDEEHGTSVCVHGVRPLSHGGLGDQGGWPPPSPEDLDPLAGLMGFTPTVEHRQAQIRKALEAAHVDPANGAGIRELTRAALELVDDPNQSLEITVRIDTPPVTRVEKVYYGRAGTLSYDLTFSIGHNYVTFKDSATPRQASLNGAPWPLSLFAPQCQWPEARPQWDTVRVRRVDLAKSMRKGKTMGPDVPELRDAAVSALKEGFDPHQLAAREWRLYIAPDPYEMADPTPQEQALGAGVAQGLQALRSMLSGDTPTSAPPDFAGLLAGVAGDDGLMGLMARTLADVDFVELPADCWSWSDPARGHATARALVEAGLELVGHFNVVIPFAPMFAAYVDPQRMFYALIYDDLYGRNVSLACISVYDDGAVYETTTRAATSASSPPPWKRVSVLPPETEPKVVLNRFLTDRPAHDPRPVNGMRLVEDLKEIHRRESTAQSQ